MKEYGPNKRIPPATLNALKEALATIYWYKPDLQSFLIHTVNEPAILARLNWSEYKRNVANALVDHLAHNQSLYQRHLIRLMAEVTRMTDFSHLERLDNGTAKASAAKSAVEALRKLTGSLTDEFDEEKAIEKRRQKSQQEVLNRTSVAANLEKLKNQYFELIVDSSAQQRGFKLEKVLKALFELFDLDPKASFRITGEQIDGAFTFENTDFLLEAKWQKEPVAASDLDGLAGKLSRKLDNTLGLFLSINGFSDDGVTAHSSGRRVMILMDGMDLIGVFEGRIDLVQLLHRKRREASQTGNIYFRLQDILSGG